MGIGIWSMHYLGMLAFHLPVPIEYDWHNVALSFLAAILASVIALFVVSQRTIGVLQTLLGIVLIGGAIASMHFIGMSAMRLSAVPRYSPASVVVSVFLAIIISLVALVLTFRFRSDTIFVELAEGCGRTGNGLGRHGHALHRRRSFPRLKHHFCWHRGTHRRHVHGAGTYAAHRCSRTPNFNPGSRSRSQRATFSKVLPSVSLSSNWMAANLWPSIPPIEKCLAALRKRCKPSEFLTSSPIQPTVSPTNKYF
jgi:signaling repeat-containing protein